MGDRWFLELNCPYCGEHNSDVYYAPTCEFYTHRCDVCDEEFEITPDFCAVRRGKLTEVDKEAAYSMASNRVLLEQIVEGFVSEGG